MENYLAVGNQLKLIEKFEEKGRDFVVLEDGSKWFTFFSRRGNAGFWTIGDVILVKPGRQGKITTYHLRNLNEKEMVKAIFKGFIN